MIFAIFAILSSFRVDYKPPFNDVQALRAWAQSPSESSNVRNIFEKDEMLSSVEIAQLLAASQKAMTGLVFKVQLLPNAGSSDGSLEVEFGAGGRLRHLRGSGGWAHLFEDYTGKTGRLCSGGLASGELVIEYVTIYDGVNPVDVPDRDGFVSDGAGGRIKVGAHIRDSDEQLAEELEMYANERPLSIGRRAVIDGHVARPLITHHELRPADRAGNAFMYPREVEDWLWIDVKSLFIVRWEILTCPQNPLHG